MANAFYNRGANFNPDELADGDAIEAEFDAVARGFDTIGTNVDANKAGYPTQTFHVAPATETTHAVRKEQLDAGLLLKLNADSYTAADVLSKINSVDGDGSGLDADLLDGNEGAYYRNASNLNSGTLSDERLTGNVYKKWNILGTVSQSGGIPTGAVIEGGSNSNGSYVRFADGTQICIISQITQVVPASSSADFSKNFPASFVGTPSVGAGVQEVQTGLARSSIELKQVYVNSTTFQATAFNGFWSSISLTVSAVAVGRWF